MLRPLVAALGTIAVLLAVTTESRGQGGSDSLTAEQREARAQFMQDLEPSVQAVKESCKVALDVRTDFQNVDTSAEFVDRGPKKKGGAPSKERRARVVACRNVLDALAEDCERHPAQVKAVACLVAGHQPRQKHEDMAEYEWRNMSFDKATGLLTVRHTMDGSWAASNYAEEAVRAILRPESKAGRFNGVSCTAAAQCRSNLCRAGTCTPCSKNGDCASGLLCNSGTHGCYEPYQGSSSDDDRPSPSAGKGGGKPKKRGKGLGQSCKSTSECEEGRVCSQRTAKLRTCQ